MVKKLTLTLFGNPTISQDNQPITGFISNKSAALFYYLVTTGRSHARETLAGLLWGNFPDTNARKNLRDVLYNLRRLAGDYLTITRSEAGFNWESPYELDLEAFMALLASMEQTDLDKITVLPHTAVSQLREAVDLYQGEFLEGFYLSQTPEFEKWMLAQREQFHQLAMQALHYLSVHFARQADYNLGIQYSTRLLALEPWREESHRRLMRLLAWSGQRMAALAQYETCAQVLEEELGVEPAPETTELYDQILAGDVTSRLPHEEIVVTSDEMTPSLHNLPTQLMPFVGREIELEQVMTQLKADQTRLLTLVGPGGIGKTRLALRVAASLLPDIDRKQIFPHGVYLISLASVETADFVASPTAFNPIAGAIAGTLGLSFSGSEDPVVQLHSYLCDKDMLLIIDNFEHLLIAARFLAELLQVAPALKLLVTSRGRLNIRGERVYAMGGLEFPLVETGEPALWQSYSAVQLFKQTAQTIDASFTLQASDESAVIRICQLVDGLPLGVELAATWVRMLSCPEIADEIEQNIGFLETTMRDIPARHRSLRAVFEYSWNLLAATEQQALQQLSVFRGGFNRDAAAAVAGASLPVLTTLVDSSLVRRAASEQGQARYELLEVIRQYAAEKLLAAAEGEKPTCDRHCHYYLTLLEAHQGNLQGGQQRKSLQVINVAIENIRAAWRWACKQGHVALIGRALVSLFHFYDMRSWFQESADVFQKAATAVAAVAAKSQAAADQLVWGNLVARYGWFTFHLGRQTEAKTLLEESLTILRPLDQPAALIFPLNYLGAVHFYLGTFEMGQDFCQQSLTLCQTVGDQYGAAIAYNILGLIAYQLGEHEEARQFSQKSLAIEKSINNRWSMTFSLANLGKVAYAMANYEEANELFQQSLEIARELGDARGVARCLNQLAETAVARQDYEKAQAHYQKSLAIFREIGNQWGMTMSLTGLGHIAQHQGDYRQAKAYFDDALQKAMSIQATPRVIDILQEQASLFTELGQVAWAEKVHPLTQNADISQNRLAALVEEALRQAVPEPDV